MTLKDILEQIERNKLAYGGKSIDVLSPNEIAYNANKITQESAIEAATDPTVQTMNMLGNIAINTGTNLLTAGISSPEFNPTSGIGKFLKNNPDILKNFTNTTAMIGNSFAYGGNIEQINPNDSILLPAPAKRIGKRKNKDGTFSTHLYSWGETDNGYVVFPTLFQNDRNEYYETKNPFEEAKKRKEVLFFKDKKQAESYAKGDWKNYYNFDGTPKFAYGGGIIDLLKKKLKEAKNYVSETSPHIGNIIKEGKKYIKESSPYVKDVIKKGKDYFDETVNSIENGIKEISDNVHDAIDTINPLAPIPERKNLNFSTKSSKNSTYKIQQEDINNNNNLDKKYIQYVTKSGVKPKNFKCKDNECASYITNSWVNNTLLPNQDYPSRLVDKTNLRGNAWTMPHNTVKNGAKRVVSVNDIRKNDLIATKGDRDKINKIFDEETAKPEYKSKILNNIHEGDIVELQYRTSPNFKKAYDENMSLYNKDKNNTLSFNTHIGQVYRYDDGLYVHHNVHGTVKVEKVDDLVAGKNKNVRILGITKLGTKDKLSNYYDIDTENAKNTEYGKSFLKHVNENDFTVRALRAIKRNEKALMKENNIDKNTLEYYKSLVIPLFEKESSLGSKDAKRYQLTSGTGSDITKAALREYKKLNNEEESLGMSNIKIHQWFTEKELKRKGYDKFLQENENGNYSAIENPEISSLMTIDVLSKIGKEFNKRFGKKIQNGEISPELAEVMFITAYNQGFKNFDKSLEIEKSKGKYDWNKYANASYGKNVQNLVNLFKNRVSPTYEYTEKPENNTEEKLKNDINIINKYINKKNIITSLVDKTANNPFTKNNNDNYHPLFKKFSFGGEIDLEEGPPIKKYPVTGVKNAKKILSNLDSFNNDISDDDLFNLLSKLSGREDSKFVKQLNPINHLPASVAQIIKSLTPGMKYSSGNSFGENELDILRYLTLDMLKNNKSNTTEAYGGSYSKMYPNSIVLPNGYNGKDFDNVKNTSKEISLKNLNKFFDAKNSVKYALGNFSIVRNHNGDVYAVDSYDIAEPENWNSGDNIPKKIYNNTRKIISKVRPENKEGKNNGLPEVVYLGNMNDSKVWNEERLRSAFNGKNTKKNKYVPNKIQNLSDSIKNKDIIGIMTNMYNNFTNPGNLMFAHGGEISESTKFQKLKNIMLNNNVPVEIEGDEVGQLPNGEVFEAQGPDHEQGGIKTMLPEGTEMYSKRIKIDGVSMADRKKKRKKKTLTLEQLLEKNNTDALLKNALERTNIINEKEEEADNKVQEFVGQLLPTPVEKKGLGGPLVDKSTLDYLNKTFNPLINNNVFSDITPGVDTLQIDNKNPIKKTNNIINGLKGLTNNNGIIKDEYLPYFTGKKNSITPLSVPTIDKSRLLPYFVPEQDESSMFDKIKDAFGNVNIGDIISTGGGLYNAFAPLNLVKEMRAGDTPNINAYKHYGEDSLNTLKNNEHLYNYFFNKGKQDLEASRRDVMSRNHNSARGISTLRALDLATEALSEHQQNELYDKYLSQLLANSKEIANTEMNRDLYQMHGEEKRDLNDRRDRDNYYSQLSAALANLGEGLQHTGKNLNDMKLSQATLNLLNQISKYGIESDMNGNLKVKKNKK